MYDTYSDGWRADGRGFWTKRKKTATSLLSVLALVAGIAVAYKLFDRTVPNNVVRDAATFDYLIFKMDDGLGDEEFIEAGADTPIYEAGVDQFPGDTRRVEVKLQNTNSPARDASFFLHIRQDNITVRGCDDIQEDGSCGATPEITVGSDEWVRFVNFWTLTVQRQKVLQAAGQEVQQDDHSGQNRLDPDGNPDDSGMRQYTTACSAGLRELVAADPCDLGMIKAAGSRDALGEQLDVRYYRFDLAEADDGSDQSAFLGWTITFDFVFNARVPAVAESSLIGER